MKIVWVIVIYNFFHQPISQLPTPYPDAASCRAAMVGTAVNGLGNWSDCVPVGVQSGRLLKR